MERIEKETIEDIFKICKRNELNEEMKEKSANELMEKMQFLHSLFCSSAFQGGETFASCLTTLFHPLSIGVCFFFNIF